MKVVDRPIEENIKNIPYKLPEGWKWVSLSRVSEINPKKTEVRDLLNENIKVSFIPMNSLDGKTGEIIDYQVKKISEVYKGYTYFKEGDIIFAKITPCMENGKCAIANNLENKIGFGSTEFHVVRPYAQVDNKWIWHLLRHPRTREEAIKHFTGAVGQKRVPESYLKNLVLPLPFKNNHSDLEKQKQIVERIENVFKKIEQAERLRQTALEKTKATFDAVLNKIFKEAEEGKGWMWVSLETIADIFDHLRKPLNSDERAKIKGEYPYCGANGIVDYIKDYIFDGEYLLIAEDGGFFKKYEESAYIFKGKFWANNHVHILKAKETATLNEYLYYFIYHEDLEKYCSGATRLKLTQTKLREISVPVPNKDNHPDLEKQKQIVDYLNKLKEKIKQLEELQGIQLTKFTALRESILNKAFRGEL